MAIRFPFKLRQGLAYLIRPIRVRIKAGPNAGLQWSLAAAGRHLSGQFEPDRMKLIEAIVRKGDCVWDVGAHHGYVTLFLSRLVGDEGQVCAFEPSAYNYNYLSRHVAWNRPENVTMYRKGLWSSAGEVRFGGEGSSQGFHVGGDNETVEVTTIRGLLNKRVPVPDVVKLDIEGAEGEVLKTNVRDLPAHCVAVISVHSTAAYTVATSALKSADFRVVLSDEVQKRRDWARWGYDPDIVALGPETADALLSAVLAAPGFANGVVL